MIILSDLPCRHDALEPVISTTTLRLHHGKHPARYVEVTNALLGEAGETAASLEDVVNHAIKPKTAPFGHGQELCELPAPSSPPPRFPAFHRGLISTGDRGSGPAADRGPFASGRVSPANGPKSAARLTWPRGCPSSGTESQCTRA